MQLLSKTTSALALTFFATVGFGLPRRLRNAVPRTPRIHDATCIAVGSAGPGETRQFRGQAWDVAQGMLKVEPRTGPLLGNRRVRIDLNASVVPGNWWANENDLTSIDVSFGGSPCPALEVIDRMIWCTIPPHTAGLVDVMVTLPNGTSFGSLGAFEYVETPAELETPYSVLFEKVTVGDSRVLSVKLVNTGDRAAFSVQAHVSGGDFSVERVCDQLESGAMCDLVITFRPTSLGGQTGVVEIEYLADGAPRCRALPVTGGGSWFPSTLTLCRCTTWVGCDLFRFD